MSDAEKDGYEKDTHRQTYEQQGKKDLDYHKDDPEFVRLHHTDSWERYDADKHNKNR